VRDKLGCNDGIIPSRSARFEPRRLAGLFSRHKGSEARTLTPALEARLLERTRQALANGSTRRSMRQLAKVLKTYHLAVARVWAKHGLKSHRRER